jgi:hypothetical protein
MPVSAGMAKWVARTYPLIASSSAGTPMIFIRSSPN